jgi:hypothetical protein
MMNKTRHCGDECNYTRNKTHSIKNSVDSLALSLRKKAKYSSKDFPTGGLLGRVRSGCGGGRGFIRDGSHCCMERRARDDFWSQGFTR